ncbi:unnamed protein product [Kuraishia capsulata CBS 1993]|uniref:Glutathione reductase n=1 Tax=Kuraishia capsulata CBS 1993 TaxID=1382522 RepID=W6MR14_9ASCO|nr:uncharacterized protein KUCA_T00005128001 [Kuraishia capsulata CBS 1993]CDK29141.1 unnamed protein product [Kuraishia capsulata CBS 1993]
MLRAMKTHYDYLVIGGGSGGVASARRAAKHGASALVIEAKAMGGTCVNVGCVPKKIMWYTSDMASKLRIAKEYGFGQVEPEYANSFDWARIKQKRDAYIARLNGIYERNMTKEGVDFVYGYARFNKDGAVEVTAKDNSVTTYTADNILIATGGAPVKLDVPGAGLGIDSDGFFALEEQPKRVAVVGAGYIGIEFAGVFNGLGSETHLIIRGDTVLRKFDDLIQQTITDKYIKSGINLHKRSSVTHVTKNADGSLKVELNGGASEIEVDTLIWTVGRKSLIPLGVKEIGLKLNSHDQVLVDEYQQTNVPKVFSLGDVVGNVELTPVAIATGRRLSNRLFGPEQFAKQKMDFENIPSVVFSHPQSGTIGLTEKEAIEKYGADDIKVYTSKFTSMYYAMVEDVEHKDPTAYKLVCLKSQNEKVIGLHIVGDDSAEILQGFGVAVKMGATKQDFDNCVAIHPTSAEELVTMT